MRLSIPFLLLLASLSASAQPELRLSPDTLRFGEVPVGAELSGEFVLIESIGDEPITIKIHAAFQPFWMPFDQRYRLAPVTDGLIDSRAASISVIPVRTGLLGTDVAVDTDERGAYVVQARAMATEPVTFSVATGETETRTLSLRNPGFAPLDARAEAASSWLRASPTSYSLAPDEEAELTVSVDAFGLAPGIYADTIRAVNDATRLAYRLLLPVSLTVTGSTSSAPGPVARQPILEFLSAPARGGVRVRYRDVPSSSSLTIYDARGRQVARLGPVSGDGERRWTAPAPGLYVLRLVHEEGSLARTVAVVR